MPKILNLGTLKIDLNRQTVESPAGPLILRRKSFEVLCYLANNAGRVVGKAELFAAVWHDVIVGDDSLTQCIAEIRRALGEDGRDLIKTIPRRGYLLDASRPNGCAEPLVLPDRPGVAVLPFLNVGGGSQTNYLSDGITEDIATELCRFQELFVIARNSSFRYRGRSVDVRQIGRELGVHYVLEGSVQLSHGRVRITAQLTEAASGQSRWGDCYVRTLSDCFEIQEEIAQTIVALLTAHVRRAESQRSFLKPPTEWQAYDYYLRGVEAFAIHWKTARELDLLKARQMFEKSLALDPTYVRAIADLARTYGTGYANPVNQEYLSRAVLDKALGLGHQAVGLDPNLPQAHAQLGMLLSWNREHDASLRAFERAEAINRNFSDIRFAAALLYSGDFKAAIAKARSYMRLDPFYLPMAPAWLGLAHYMLGEYLEAISVLNESVERMPNFQAGHLRLAACYAQLGDIGKAQASARQVLRIDPAYSFRKTEAPLIIFRRTKDAEHYYEGIRKAGLPE